MDSLRDSEFVAYQKAVCGSKRSEHTFSKRLLTVEELAKSFHGKDILDVGCGYGFRTVGIARKGAKSVTGIDSDSVRIQQATEYSNSLGVSSIRFLLINAEYMDFEDESFDIITADEMIHHVEDVDKVLKELVRITKKGGVIIISDHNKWSVLSQLVRYICFGKKRAKLFSAKEIAGHFKRLGLRDVVYKHIIFAMPFSGTPDIILRLNYKIENIVESLPLIRSQCGVYVVRGIK